MSSSEHRDSTVAGGRQSRRESGERRTPTPALSAPSPDAGAALKAALLSYSAKNLGRQLTDFAAAGGELLVFEQKFREVDCFGDGPRQTVLERRYSSGRRELINISADASSSAPNAPARSKRVSRDPVADSRVLTLPEAAAHVRLSEGSFLAEVEAGTYPPPLATAKVRRRRWLKAALDACLDATLPAAVPAGREARKAEWAAKRSRQ